MLCMSRMCVLHWDFSISQFTLIFRRFGDLFGVVLGVLLGSVWASWPSWSRLGAILGRLDAIFDVLEFCSIFGSSPEEVYNIRAVLAKKTKCIPPPRIGDACAGVRIREDKGGFPSMKWSHSLLTPDKHGSAD